MTKRTLYIVLGVIILLAVAVVAVIVLVRARNHRVPQTATTQAPLHIHPTYAPTGQLAAGFPKDLLVGAAPAISESYITAFGQQTQATATYTDREPVNALLQAFLAYFRANGFGVISTTHAGNTESLYAVKKDADISVIITPGQGQCSVVVSYLKK